MGAGLQAFFDTHGSFIPPFRQRFPWVGADLQTLRNSFAGKLPTTPIHKRLLAPIVSGEQQLNIAVSSPAAGHSNGMAVMLIHGLGGNEDSFYKQATAQSFLRDGWTVYRLNYRGVGPSRSTSKPPYSGGLTDDLRSALYAMAEDANGKKLYAVGFSLGGQLLLRTLGEGGLDIDLCGAVTVSAPLDLARALAKLQRPRNAIYVRYLVNNMKRDLGQVGREEFGIEPELLTSVWAFDEYIIAPAFGYQGAADYYEKVSCFSLLENIQVPLLAVHSKDDPWIPWEDYKRATWPQDRSVGGLLLKRGGHVGFHGSATDGAWFEVAAKEFFAKHA